MTMPFFSIVIPTFNRSDLLPYAVQSVLNQTFEDFEIIISDNCSSDDTPMVAKQFTDTRVKYVRTPRHYTIADAWEFARREAAGKLIMMLSDDDALISTALQRFADASIGYDADFLFSHVAEYHDGSYPGPERNSVKCPAFSGVSRIIQSEEEFIKPLFSFRPKFNMHPSAFIFAKRIADLVADKTGRFFWTNGVEYSAWPITAIFARNIAYIDVPLTVLGRTGKSWGTNIVLCNPGKERIDAFIQDVDHERQHAPLNNFTLCNLMAEGMLTAKSLFPKEFASYDFDEVQYLRRTLAELKRRKALGVDVSTEMDDLRTYAAKYSGFTQELDALQLNGLSDGTERVVRRLRVAIGNLGVRRLRQRVKASQLARRLEVGAIGSGFYASGGHFGFFDVLGCTQFLQRAIDNCDCKAAVPSADVGAANEIANLRATTQNLAE
jgi:glycosyltransferase involved in cell wall biosynthesis